MQTKALALRIANIILVTVLLAGCGSFIQTAPPPVPTLVLDAGAAAPATQTPVSSSAAAALPASGGTVSASGNIAPAQLLAIASNTGGMIKLLDVQVGDRVEAGQVLVRLAGAEKLAAAVESANYELLAARQAMIDLNDNAGQARAKAQKRLALAKDALDEATKHRGWKNYRPGDDDQIAVARADLIVAEDYLKRVQDAYGGFADNPVDNLDKAAAISAISAARKARDKAVGNLNFLLAMPDTIEVEKADADVAIATAELDAAQREFETLKNGPDPMALSLASERIKNAEAQLNAAQAALADLEITAPFSGVVSKVSAHSGAWVMPGQAILTIADLEHLRVETTDLSERDVPQVEVGQSAAVRVKALGVVLKGRVSEIAPLADTLGGDVVYTTYIELENPPQNLRAGMSVDVEFGGE
jgi:multidrug efflux pump subunit AcrA (membrane-fusion protein)